MKAIITHRSFEAFRHGETLRFRGGEQLRGSVDVCGGCGGGLLVGIRVSQKPLRAGLRLCRTGERDEVAVCFERQHGRNPIVRRKLDTIELNLNSASLRAPSTFI